MRTDAESDNALTEILTILSEDNPVENPPNPTITDNSLDLIILISAIGGGAVIGAVIVLFIKRRRK